MAGARIQLKRATAASWSSSNPILFAGEIGLETDTNKFKIGNGSTAFNSLPYFNGNLAGSNLNDLADVTIVSAADGDFLRWNGTAWINDAVNLSTDTIGSYVESLVAGTGVTLTNNSGEGATPTIAIGQSVSTSSSVTFGHVSAPVTGNVIGDVTGNADTATSLETSRTISLGGDLSGSASFDGTSDITISASVVDSGVSLDEISDVVINSPLQFQGLMYDGANWVNSNIPDVYLVRNNTGSTIPKGTLVGAVGAEPSGRIDVAPFEVTGTENSELRAMGIATSNISNGVNGEVMSFGTLTGLDTRGSTTSALAVGDETWAAGDILFAHPTVDGKLTNVRPQHDLAVAFITVRHASTGQIAIRIIPGNNHLEWMHDVVLSSPTDGQFLRYNSASAVWVNDEINLGTDTTGNFVNDVISGTGVTVTHTPGEGSSASIAIGQDVATSASVTFAHVSAYLTGNVTGDLIGNADTATALETSRKISLSGDLSGSVSFDGTADVTISAIVQPDSVALGTDTTGNYVNDVTSGTGVTVTHTPGEGSSPTIAIGQDVGTSASVTFAKVTAEFVGDVTGNSDTATSLETARVISLSGDLSGSVSFDGTSDAIITATVQPNSVALGADTTGNYVSDVTAGTGVTVTHTPGEGSSPTIAIGQAVSTSSSVQFAEITTTGDVVVGGSLTVNGTQTILNTDVLAVEDNFVILNAGVSGTPTLNAGITVNRGSSPLVSLFWNEDADNWQAVTDGINVYDIAFGQNVFTSSSVQFANVTSNLVGDVTGKADRADRLEASRAISLSGDLSGSVAFDGTENVTLNATIQPNSVALGTDTTGNYVESLAAGTGVGITLSNESGESVIPTIAIGQDVGTSASVTFSKVTADLVGDVTGNASTATTLQNTRTISLSGDVTGSASFNGSADSEIVVTIPANSIVLGTDTTGNYVSDVTAGTGIGVIHIGGEGSAPEISLNAYLNDINDVNLTVAPTDGQFLKYVSASTAWIAANIPTINSLDDIADVTITSASVSQVLQWNGTAWVNTNPGATVTVSDTAPGSPTEGDLWFDSTTLDTFVRYDSSWIQLNDSGSPIEVLDDLFDVSVQDVEPDQFLKYDGTDWVPASPVLPTSINTRTTNYTLTLSDVNRLVEMNMSVANTVTVPTNSSQAIPIGSKIEIFQYGSGKTQIIGDTGVTIRTTPGSYLNAQYSYATLIKRGTNEWILFGDLSAS